MTMSKGAMKPRPAEAQHNATCHLQPRGACWAPAWASVGSHSTHDQHIIWIVRKSVNGDPQMRVDCSETRLVQTFRSNRRPRIEPELSFRLSLRADIKKNADCIRTNLPFASLHLGLLSSKKG